MPEKGELYEYTGLLNYPLGVYEYRGVEEGEKTLRMKRVRNGDGEKTPSEVKMVGLDDFEADFEKHSER